MILWWWSELAAIFKDGRFEHSIAYVRLLVVVLNEAFLEGLPYKSSVRNYFLKRYNSYSQKVDSSVWNWLPHRPINWKEAHDGPIKNKNKKKDTLDKLSHVTWQLFAKANHMGTHPSLRARRRNNFHYCQASWDRNSAHTETSTTALQHPTSPPTPPPNPHLGSEVQFYKYPWNWNVSVGHNPILGNCQAHPFLSFLPLPPSPWNLGCFDAPAVWDTFLLIS